MQKVILKKGKEFPILQKHHWIFSGAVERLPQFEDGDILEVYSSSNRFLGLGYFNKKSQIVGRMLTFNKTNPVTAIRSNIVSAIKLREKLFNSNSQKKETNCFRLINSEGDSIPGLTIDNYNGILVMQISTLGIELLKEEIVHILAEEFNPKGIYEKSSMPSRKQEGLDNFEGILYNHDADYTNVEVLENGVKFRVNIEKGHKTGFYLDQREMRNLIGSMAKDRKVLNCFSYTGGFSIYAALNGATEVTSVDLSSEVIKEAEVNFKLNTIDPKKHRFVAQDVFEFLKNETINYDIVILDPPAFAKKKDDYARACNAYGQINRLAFKKMPKGSFLLTCSCSYHVDEESFRKVIFRAAHEAERNVRILETHRHAMDHPLNIFNPEANYLKSLLLYVE